MKWWQIQNDLVVVVPVIRNIVNSRVFLVDDEQLRFLLVLIFNMQEFNQ